MARPRKTQAAATRGSGITHAQLVREAKKDPSHSAAANALGVAVGAFSSMQWSRALVEAGQYDVIPQKQRNANTIQRLYEDEGYRWELIAAVFETSVADVKDLAGGAEVIANWTRATKGGNGNGETSTRGSSKKTTAASTKKGSVKRTSARSSKKASTAQSASTPRRARTRAARRAAQSNNPS